MQATATKATAATRRTQPRWKRIGNKNAYKITVGGVTIYRSYRARVAIYYHEANVIYFTSFKWSQTTTRHRSVFYRDAGWSATSVVVSQWDIDQASRRVLETVPGALDY